MLKILFWNLNQRPREKLCAALAQLHTPQIVVLAECANPVVFVRELQRSNSDYFLLQNPQKSRVRIITSFHPNTIQSVRETRRYVIHSLTLTSAEEFLLVSAHLRSKQQTQEREQDSELRRFAQEIVEAEAACGHKRTILIGDLNAHPFQDGICAADGLHALMTKASVRNGSRIIDQRRTDFFYNPMWRFFGETPLGPPGTYYWPGYGANVAYLWHILDQAMIRPSLVPYFPADGIQILTGDGTISYEKNGRPDPDIASDHFPILLKLNYPGV